MLNPKRLAASDSNLHTYNGPYVKLKVAISNSCALSVPNTAKHVMKPTNTSKCCTMYAEIIGIYNHINLQQPRHYTCEV